MTWQISDQSAIRLRWALAASTVMLLVASVLAAVANDGGGTSATEPVGPQEAGGTATSGLPLVGVTDTPLGAETLNGAAGAESETVESQLEPDEPGATAGGASATTRPAGWLPVGPDTHGVTDTTMEFGMIDADADAAFAGVSAVTGGDAEAEGFGFKENALGAVDAVNSMGGVAGRKIVPVFYRAEIAGYFAGSTRNQSYQERCALWTEDHDVFAFNNSGTAIMADCAARTKTVWIPTRTHLRLTERHARSIANYYYEPNDLHADRSNRALVRFLLSHGAMAEGAKVGLMIQDEPDSVAGAEAMKPVLAAAGFAPVVEVHYPDPIESPWNNYVLQMQANGVTNVVFAVQSEGTFAGVFMMQAAENQRYRPKWHFGSDMQLASFATFGGQGEQLANVFSMGWQPVLDTADPDPEAVDAHFGRICDEHLERHDQAAGNAYGRSECESLFFLRAAFEHANEVSPAGLAAGVAALGDRYRSVVTIGGRTFLGAGRHDGVTTVRPVSDYDPETLMPRYTGPPEPAPT